MAPFFQTERFRHKPYVKEGFPRNATVLVGASALFECPLYADLSAFYQWFRLSPEDGAASAAVRGDEPPNGTLIQVKKAVKGASVAVSVAPRASSASFGGVQSVQGR